MSDAATEPLHVRAEAVLSRTEDCRVPERPEEYEGLRGAALDEEIEAAGALLAEGAAPDATDEDPAVPVAVARLEARLGSLLAVRSVLGGAEEDRVRAQDLLAEARRNDLLTERERVRARKDLILLLVRRLSKVAAMHSGPLDEASFTDMMWVGRPGSQGGPGYAEDIQLLYRLASESGLAGRFPASVRALMDTLSRLTTLRMDDRQAVSEFAKELRTSSVHLPPLLRHVMETAASLLRPGTASRSLDRPADRSGPQEEQEEDDAFVPEFLALLEATSPQAVRGEEVSELVRRLTRPGSPLSSRMIAVMLRISLGMRTADRGHLHSALEQLQEAARAGEFATEEQAEWLHVTMSMLLVLAGETGGSLLDTEAAQELLASLPPLPAGGTGSGMRALADCMRVQLRLTELRETRDLAATDLLIDELHDLDTTALTAEGLLGVLEYTLGYAYLSRAQMSRSRADMHQAAIHMENAQESFGGSAHLQTLTDLGAAPLYSLSALLGSGPDHIREGLRRTRTALGKPGLTFDSEVKTRLSLAIGLDTLYLRTGEPDALDECVAELEAACRLLPPEGAPDAQSAYWQLASALAGRATARAGTPQAAEDLRAAVSAARRSLRAAADEVLLQLGVRHGLRAARRGADHGCTAASWALAAGRVDEAVDCLEAGRSLVLAAAAESRSVADRLEALGAAELAVRWREAAVPAAPGAGDGASEGAPGTGDAKPDGTPGVGGGASGADGVVFDGTPGAGDVASDGAGGAEDAVSDGVPGAGDAAGVVGRAVFAAAGGGPALPGDVRRQALDLLRSERRETEDMTPADRVAALRDGLVRADVDALVHLLPGGGTDDGAVLLITPEGPARSVPLPALSAEGRAPLTAFLDADAERKRVDADAGASPQEVRRAGARWREALDEVCVWAGEVLTPVLDTLDVWPRALAEAGLAAAWAGGGPAARAVRLVLVPCGTLGVVPWPAAVLRPPAEPGGPGQVRAFEVSVISHAASGQEFLRASARTRMSPGKRPALAFHGDDRLAWAEEEIELLHEVYYPHAEVYRDPDAPATPQTVLSLLGGRAESAASLVHLSCHGIAGPDPTTSALRLAPSRPGGPAPDRDAYEPLTLATLLETPHDGEAYRSRGPLVVCGACETDLTTRDHDEALTVTSVLVHRLAADAVGTRWGVDDDESEILMLVLHDRLAAGAAPPDALRAAQRWMLTDPGERPPVRALERVRTRRWNRDFRDADVWAAFVHHGNPSGGTPQ
ncbi:CHAT domain-containing protein [Streptomyces sp. NRRL S-37]|uniref:CHAT domain-containing protein n=1 Tax=Streptomyces sp. NRRL S-37 TaxID=1463903 RepID=UPI0004CB3DFA|nr:CHAT domain-containing protein [Streptomyces sp. NRRL S-37]